MMASLYHSPAAAIAASGFAWVSTLRARTSVMNKGSSGGWGRIKARDCGMFRSSERKTGRGDGSVVCRSALLPLPRCDVSCFVDCGEQRIAGDECDNRGSQKSVVAGAFRLAY